MVDDIRVRGTAKAYTHQLQPLPEAVGEPQIETVGKEYVYMHLIAAFSIFVTITLNGKSQIHTNCNGKLPWHVTNPLLEIAACRHAGRLLA